MIAISVTALVGATSQPAVAALDPLVARVDVDLGVDDAGAPFSFQSFREISDNGRFALLAATSANGSRDFHLDLETSVVTPLAISRGAVEESGEFVHRLDSGPERGALRIVEREAVGSQTIQQIEATTIDLGFGVTRTPPKMVDRTNDGRYLLLNSTSIEAPADSPRSTWDLYDTATATHLTPDGLPQPAAATYTADRAFTADGSEFTYLTYAGTVWNPQPPLTHETIDLATGERTSRNVAGPIVNGQVSVSPKGTFAVFVSNSVDGPPEPGERLRWYRKNLVTGDVELVGGIAEREFSTGFLIRDDGTVTYTTAQGLFAWNGGDTTQLDLGTDDEQFDIASRLWSRDGSKMLFTSDSTNLPDAVPGEDGFYVIDTNGPELTTPAPTPPPLAEPADPDALTADEIYGPLEPIGFGDRASSVFSVSANGEYLTIRNTNGAYFHVSVDDGVITRLESRSPRPTDDGEFVTERTFDPEVNDFRVTGIERVGSRTIEPVPAIRVDLGYDESWPVSHVAQTTPDGRYQLLSSYRGGGENIRRYVVWDTVTLSALTPTDGLPTPGGDSFISSIGFDENGTSVLYRTQCCVGATYSTFDRLDFVTGERTTIEMEYPSLGLNWHASPNREWRVFYAASFGIGDFDGRARVYRENLVTGEVDEVPVRNGIIEELTSIVVSDSGVIVYDGEDATGWKQIEAWAGTGNQGQLLTQGVDGQPGDWGVETARFVNGGDTIVLSSRSSNLDDGPNDARSLRFYATNVLADGDTPPPDPTPPAGGGGGGAGGGAPAPAPQPAPEPGDETPEPDAGPAPGDLGEDIATIAGSARVEQRASRCEITPSC